MKKVKITLLIIVVALIGILTTSCERDLRLVQPDNILSNDPTLLMQPNNIIILFSESNNHYGLEIVRSPVNYSNIPRTFTLRAKVGNLYSLNLQHWGIITTRGELINNMKELNKIYEYELSDYPSKKIFAITHNGKNIIINIQYVEYINYDSRTRQYDDLKIGYEFKY